MSHEEADDRDTARSRHGYVITYAGAPIVWKSQLQTEIALSSCESEYTGLSYALRDAIPMIELLKEMKTMGFKIIQSTPRVKCKAYEDNSGALEIAMNHKYRPRTKHLNCRLHHFRDYITRILSALVAPTARRTVDLFGPRASKTDVPSGPLPPLVSS